MENFFLNKAVAANTYFVGLSGKDYQGSTVHILPKDFNRELPQILPLFNKFRFGMYRLKGVNAGNSESFDFIMYNKFTHNFIYSKFCQQVGHFNNL